MKDPKLFLAFPRAISMCIFLDGSGLRQEMSTYSFAFKRPLYYFEITLFPFPGLMRTLQGVSSWVGAVGAHAYLKNTDMYRKSVDVYDVIFPCGLAEGAAYQYVHTYLYAYMWAWLYACV